MFTRKHIVELGVNKNSPGLYRSGGCVGDCVDFSADADAFLWIAEHGGVFRQQLIGEGCEIVIPQPDDKKRAGEDVIDFAGIIPQRAVQRQPEQLAGFAADDADGIGEGVQNLDIPADGALQGCERMRDLRRVRYAVRRDGEDADG